MKTLHILTLALFIVNVHSVALTSFCLGCIASSGGAATLLHFLKVKMGWQPQPIHPIAQPALTTGTIALRYIPHAFGAIVGVVAQAPSGLLFAHPLSDMRFRNMAESYFAAREDLEFSLMARYFYHNALAGKITFSQVQPLLEAQFNNFDASALSLFTTGQWLDVTANFDSLNHMDEFFRYGIIADGNILYNVVVKNYQAWIFVFAVFIYLMKRCLNLNEFEERLTRVESRVDKLRDLFIAEKNAMNARLDQMQKTIQNMDKTMQSMCRAFKEMIGRRARC